MCNFTYRLSKITVFFIKYLKSAGRENVSLWRMDELIWRFRHSSKSLGRFTNQMMRTMLRYIINCSLIGEKVVLCVKVCRIQNRPPQLKTTFVNCCLIYEVLDETIRKEGFSISLTSRRD